MLNKDSKNERLEIRTTEKEKDMLYYVAGELDMSVSKLVRKAVRYYLYHELSHMIKSNVFDRFDMYLG